MRAFSILRHGSTRSPVLVMGPLAFKFAKSERGRACNRYEANLFRTTTERRRYMLCPVLWVSSDGGLLISRSAIPLREEMSFERCLELTRQWDHVPGEDGHPFEWKPGNWGWYGKRLVALDFSATA